MRVLAIIGFPGVGKSTLMRLMIGMLGHEKPLPARRYGLMDYHLVHPTATQTGDIAVLGKYGGAFETFSGTDKLSMAVQPDAERFMINHPAGLTGIAFEGDRLGNASFLRVCQKADKFRLVVLSTDPGTLAARRAGREAAVQKQQDPTWLAGRESKVTNLQRNFFGEIRVADSAAQQAGLVDDLRSWLLGLSEAPLPSRLF